MNSIEPPQAKSLEQQLHGFQALRTLLLEPVLQAANLPKLMAYELDIARIANALQVQQSGSERTATRQHLANALRNLVSLALAGAICATQGSGKLSLVLSEAKRYHCPVGHCDFTLPLWLDALFAAIILQDRAAVALLANNTLVDKLTTAPSRQSVGKESFWLPLAHVFVTTLHYLAQSQKDPIQAGKLVEQIAACSKRMQQPGIIDPLCVASVDQPVLELLAGFVVGVDQRWQRGWQKALRRFSRYYQQTDNRLLLPGYLPLGLTALAQLAHGQGISLQSISAPVPDWLLHTEWFETADSASAGVTYYYPRHSILSAKEAHWFLDLRGFPRQGRSHRLLEQQNQLIAYYQAYNAPDIIHAVAEFTLLDNAQVEPKPPLAVDAGELLLLAEAFAEEGTSNRELLVDAIACVHSVLARIPAQQNSIPAQNIHSAEGKAFYQREPGRFGRERLQAYCDGLQRVLASSDRSKPNKPKLENPQQDPLAQLQQALAAVQQNVASSALALIRTEVEIIIQKIGEDVTGVYLPELRPRDSDYEQIFSAEAIAPARHYYQSLWQQGFRLQYPSKAHRIDTYICPAGFFAQDTSLSRGFPTGYHAIAKWLIPERVWVAWRYLKPGTEAGINYDGLVFVDDHWVWLPKPYRALAALAVPKP